MHSFSRIYIYSFRRINDIYVWFQEDIYIVLVGYIYI